MDTKVLCFLIVAYKRVDLTTACIDSIYAYEPNSTILFLDNGSQDGSYETIVKRYQSHNNFTHYTVEKNSGHAKRLNFLFEKYLAQNLFGDICVVLDNDAVLLGSITEKLDTFFSDPTIGVVGKTGYFFIPQSSLFTIVSLNKNEDTPTKVDAVATYFAAFRRKVLQHGLIDKAFEKYLYGGDDFDLCLNIKKNGFDIIFDHTFPIQHVSRGSSSLLGNDFVNEQIGETNVLLDTKWRKYYPRVLEIEKNKERVNAYIKMETEKKTSILKRIGNSIKKLLPKAS